MKRPPTSSLGFLWLAVALACAPSGSPSTTTATPVPRSGGAVPPALATAAPVPADTASGDPPRNWQLLDEATDHIAGISSERAMRELLAGVQPKRTVIVAVIDGGIDTTHEDLRSVLWLNPHEVSGNKKDDDSNGYVDDLRGWNFLGGRDGRDVDQDTFEVTRLFAGCQHRAPSGDFSALPAADRALCTKVAADYNKQKQEMEQELPNIQGASKVFDQVTTVLKKALGSDSLTDDAVAKLKPATPEAQQAKAVYAQMRTQKISRDAIDEALKEVDTRLHFGLDPAFNPRTIIGDDTTNLTERGYGNPDVMGPDAEHGTHVSGIIGAVRGNGIGIDGIAPAVKIMMIRTIPDGDEHDKDVANAIRYAVDNGASVVNMSFGKSYSPAKSVVDAAAKYADAHNVLLVAAAGNDGANSDSVDDFPNRYYLDGGQAQNWIEVGASSWQGGENLPAPFSNYGRQHVDLFAPGVDILSTVPHNKYQRESGTSMAAPVVTGVAALLMSYFPTLSAADIKHIILNSATRHPDQQVLLPGSSTGQKVPFGSLSATGGIVNAYNAIRMAQEMTGGKR